jgi:predicted GIY-YIG superfamily endonuclease
MTIKKMGDSPAILDIDIVLGYLDRVRTPPGGLSQKPYHRPPMEEWFVYYIQAGRKGPVKIGISTQPDKRLQDLQTAHYAKLVLKVKVGGLWKREAEVLEHTMYAAFQRRYHIRGEWYMPGVLHHPILQFNKCLLNKDGSPRYQTGGKV